MHRTGVLIMRIEGDTIFFKTGPEWYFAEKNGLKPFTIRLVTEAEWDDIKCWWNGAGLHKNIQISSTFSGDGFNRPVELIGVCMEGLGQRLIFISWRHSE